MLPRTTLARLTVAGVVLSLSGCSGGTDSAPRTAPPNADTDTSAAPDPTPGATNSPAPPQRERPVSRTAVCHPNGPTPKPFTGRAVTAFGAAGVMDAYCETANFFAARAVTSLTDPAQARLATVKDLTFITERLTVRGAHRWHERIADLNSASAHGAINELTFYALALDRFAYPAGGPTSVGGTVSVAHADVARLSTGQDALALWYTVTVDLPVTQGNRGAHTTHHLPLTRDVAIYVLPNPNAEAPDDTTWLIESWNTHSRVGKAHPIAANR